MRPGRDEYGELKNIDTRLSLPTVVHLCFAYGNSGGRGWAVDTSTPPCMRQFFFFFFWHYFKPTETHIEECKIIVNEYQHNWALIFYSHSVAAD